MKILRRTGLLVQVTPAQLDALADIHAKLEANACGSCGWTLPEWLTQLSIWAANQTHLTLKGKVK